MPLAHRPSANTFCFLGKSDILSPDEIESLAEKLVTLYQDDIEHRFSNQFVDYSNEFLDYAEYTIMTLSLYANYRVIKCSFSHVEIAQRTNLIL